MRRLSVLLLAAALLALTPARPAAWGPDGHRIVARIALAHLTPRARLEIERVLAGDDFIEAGNWADQVRGDRPETYNWHFVDVPYGIDEYDPARDCPSLEGGDCVLAAIDRLKVVLGDPAADRILRVEALKYLIHFIGDMHQPLHSITNADRGGNDVLVDLGGDQPSNLHAVWDRALIARRDLDEASFAKALLAQLDEHPMAPGPVDPLAWALESHEIAEQVVYRFPEFTPGRPPSRPITLEAAYWERAAPIVDQQLKRGGIRLASLLNAIFPG